MIPKEYGGFRDIGLVEVLCKTVTEILNLHLTAEIYFYNTLHGFRMGRGTVATSLGSKLLQHIIDMR